MAAGVPVIPWRLAFLAGSGVLRLQ
jgi:hypothetical protein